MMGDGPGPYDSPQAAGHWVELVNLVILTGVLTNRLSDFGLGACGWGNSPLQALRYAALAAMAFALSVLAADYVGYFHGVSNKRGLTLNPVTDAIADRGPGEMADDGWRYEWEAFFSWDKTCGRVFMLGLFVMASFVSSRETLTCAEGRLTLPWIDFCFSAPLHWALLGLVLFLELPPRFLLRREGDARSRSVTGWWRPR